MAPSGGAPTQAAGKAPRDKRPAPSSDPNSSSGRLSGRAAKRVKFSDARTIETQTTGSAFAGEVDLDSFMKSREYEIQALEASMRSSKAVNATRGFQEVPRFMRRRTASHNAKRLPKKLRDRARREMLADNTPDHTAKKGFRSTLTRSRLRAATAKKLDLLARRKRMHRQKEAAKIGRGQGTGDSGGILSRRPRPKIRQNALNDAPVTVPKYKKRQRDKVWLPTHQWHAKRAKMTVPALWGFSIPQTPTNKSYRATHRAARHQGAICWDMSYMATIRMYGNAGAIEVLLGISEKRGSSAALWKSGARLMQLPMTPRGERPPTVFEQYGPVSAVYNPLSPATDSASPPPSEREVLLYVHPAAFMGLWEALLAAIREGQHKVSLEDLRWEIGSILVKGSSAPELLQGILRPYPMESEHAGQAQCFKDMGASTSLPNGAVLSFSVQDPRLQWPPRTFRPPPIGDDGGLEDLRRLIEWPAGSALRPAAIYDRNARYKGASLPTQSSLDRRRGTQGPGTSLTVGRADPPVPIMLLETTPTSWTLLAPRACILPLWRSAMHYPLSTGGTPRFGGVDELRQVALELCQPWFPADFPATPAGLAWELEQRRHREKDWARRPKGKRVAWESLDLGAGRKGEVGSGHGCDWELLFGPSPAADIPAPEAADTEEAAEDTEMEDTSPDEADTSESPNPLQDLVRLTGRDFREALASRQPLKTASEGTDSETDPPFPSPSITTVALTMVSRGEPKPCARIYRLPSEPRIPSTEGVVPATDPSSIDQSGILPPGLRGQWIDMAREVYDSKKGQSKRRGNVKGNQGLQRMPKDVDLALRKGLTAENVLSTALPYPPPKGNKSDMGGKPLVPDEEDLIGFVTSGHFNLAMGRGSGIGHVSCAKAAEAVWMARKAPGEEGLDRLCIVRNAGESVGWLARWEAL